jgi:hypothetical protein
MYLRKETMKNIEMSFLESVSPNVGVYLNRRNVILDLISDLIKIINPSVIRPVTWQLLNENEKRLFQKLVEIYVTFGLTWKEERIRNERRRQSRRFKDEEDEETSFCLSPYSSHHTKEIKLFKFKEVACRNSNFMNDLFSAIDKLIRFEGSSHQLCIDSSSNIQRQLLSTKVSILFNTLKFHC